MKESFTIEYRFWISCNGQPIFGKGKIELLLKIEETGSLRKASEMLKMSYRKAYYSVDQMNRLAKEPIVLMTRGGKSGGKSELTDYGKKLISTYLELDREIAEYIAKKSF